MTKSGASRYAGTAFLMNKGWPLLVSNFQYVTLIPENAVWVQFLLLTEVH